MRWALVGGSRAVRECEACEEWEEEEECREGGMTKVASWKGGDDGDGSGPAGRDDDEDMGEQRCAVLCHLSPHGSAQRAEGRIGRGRVKWW